MGTFFVLCCIKKTKTPLMQLVYWPSLPSNLHPCYLVILFDDKELFPSLSLSLSHSVRPNRFAYAGTKDKRAVTCQHMTIYRHATVSFITFISTTLFIFLFMLIRGDAQKFRDINKRLFGIRTGNFR